MLESKYSDWRPKTMADLEQDDQRVWLAEKLGSCPGIAAGHFEQPNQLAYAMLLVPKLNSRAGYKVVVAVKSKNSNNYILKVIEHADGANDSGLVISKEAPGKYSGFDEAKSVRLKLDGLNVEWIEKSSQLYYYSNGRYHQLQTSD